jgi:hypothetical protein
VVSESFAVITGQACGICAQALEFAEIVDELTATYENIFYGVATSTAGDLSHLAR